MIHKDDLEIVKALYLKIFLEPDQILRTEFRIVHANKSIVWLEASVKNMLSEPSVNGVVINYRNISDRKLAEENIRISEGKYRYLFDNNPDSIFIFQEDNFSILDVNYTACHQLGFSKEEFHSMLINDIYHIEDGTSFTDLLNELNTNQQISEQKSCNAGVNRGKCFLLILPCIKLIITASIRY